MADPALWDPRNPGASAPPRLGLEQTVLSWASGLPLREHAQLLDAPLRTLNQSFPIAQASESCELLRRGDVDDNLFPSFHQSEDIFKRTSALTIPKHEANGAFIRHAPVFGGVILKIPFTTGRCGNRPDFPRAEVIPAPSFRAKDLDLVVPSALKILLNRPVCAIGIADQDMKALPDDFVEASSHLSV